MQHISLAASTISSALASATPAKDSSSASTATTSHLLHRAATSSNLQPRPW